MSAMFGVSENDQRLQNLFVNKAQVAAGIYALNVFVRGKPTIVTVDDYIPTNSGSPIFAGLGVDGALWGPILEKAWAKVSGTYERINLGMSTESLRFFTGCPTKYTDLT